MGERIALVGCGVSKRDERAPAKDLYASAYFSLKKQYAQENADDWRILSAKHHVLHPNDVIEPYDCTLDDVDTEAWAETVESQLPDADVYIFLCSQEYHEPLDVDGEYPFADTDGIVDQMKFLSK